MSRFCSFCQLLFFPRSATSTFLAARLIVSMASGSGVDGPALEVELPPALKTVPSVTLSVLVSSRSYLGCQREREEAPTDQKRCSGESGT